MIDLNLSTLPFLPFNLIGTAKGSKQLPEISAIYFCLTCNGQPVYIGQTRNLMKRWANAHPKKFQCKQLQVIRLAWLEVFHSEESDEFAKKQDRLRIEKKLIHYYLPLLNHQLWNGKGTDRRAARKAEIDKLREERFGQKLPPITISLPISHE